jgi:hypothetical protein
MKEEKEKKRKEKKRKEKEEDQGGPSITNSRST